MKKTKTKMITYLSVSIASSIILLLGFFLNVTDNNYPIVQIPETHYTVGYENQPAMVDIYPSPKHNYDSHGRAAVIIFFVLIGLNFVWGWYTGNDMHLSKKPVDKMDSPKRGQRTALGIVVFAVIWMGAAGCVYGLIHAPKGLNYITKKQITKERYESFGGSKDSIKALF